MPTIRPRHMITETERISRALDDAAHRWPEDRHNRSALLRRLVERGAEAVTAHDDARRERRRAAIEATSGVLDGVYAPEEAATLRDEWPE